MESSIKKQVNRFLSFFMAVAMVLTSMTITPLTANAKENGGQESTVSNPTVSGPTVSEDTVSGTNLTVHFKNERSWEKVYAKFGSGSSWGDIKGLEYCNASFGGAIKQNAKNAGWCSFKVESSDTVTELNGLFNNGSWGDTNQTANYKIAVSGHSEAWITYNEGTANVSYDKPAGWVDGANVQAPGDPAEEAETNLKLYYYILDTEEKDASDYGVDVWGGALLTEAGPELTVTWNPNEPDNTKNLKTLLPASDIAAIEKMPGKWGYVGLDSNKIEGIQFVTANGAGAGSVWNAKIKEENLTEAYYVKGYGWYKDAACEEEIKAKELQEDELYIVGSTSYLGAWTLEDAVKMTKTGDKQYEVTISLPAGTYEYTPVQDPKNFYWEHKYKDYENEWANYTLTLEKDGDVVFTVKNPDPTTGKAEVTAKVKEEETPTPPPVVEAKKYTVTFKDGDKVLKTETVESGKAATAPALPTKTGYTASWDKAFANVTADVTVNVKWTANTYTLTYDVNGGTKLKVATKTVTYDGTYGELASPSRKGYTFKGWYTAKTKGTKVTSSTKVTGNATIYAQWTKVTKPGKVSIRSVKNSAKKTMKVTLKRVKGADGYEVRYSTKKNMKGAKKSTSKKTTLTIKKLKKGKTYYVQARAYKLDSAGKKIYSAKYSTTKKVKIKK